MSGFEGNRVRLGIAVLCVAQFVVVLDATVVVSALPAMGRDLGFTSAGLQWVVTAYTLAFGGFLIVGGRVADLVGSRRGFTIGLVGFTAASLACGLAPSPALLLVGRVLQGVAAALLSPAALALLSSITTSESARRRGVGIWTAAAAGGGATGWVLGGLLTEYADWRWVFFVNVPVGMVVLPLIALVLPRTTGHRSGPLDAVGAVGVTLGLGLVVYGLTGAVELTSQPLLALAPLLAGIGVLVGVLRHERRVANPLLPPDVLRRRAARGANLVALAVTASTTPAMFLAVLYVQDLLDIPPGRAAWYFPALNLAVIAGSLLGPRLIGWSGARGSALAGFGLIAAGTLILTTLPSQGLPSVRLVASFTVMGIGLAIASVASTTVGTTAAPPERGLVSGLLNSAAQIGTALGLAVIIPLAARPGADPEAMLSGMRWGFLGAGLIAGLGLLAGLLLPVRDRREQLGQPAATEPTSAGPFPPRGPGRRRRHTQRASWPASGSPTR